MKTCKSFFHKSLIITSAEELKHMLSIKFNAKGYGFCLLSCMNHDYKAQRIYRFTESFDVAYSWLLTNTKANFNDTCGVVLGCDL